MTLPEVGSLRRPVRSRHSESTPGSRAQADAVVRGTPGPSPHSPSGSGPGSASGPSGRSRCPSARTGAARPARRRHHCHRAADTVLHLSPAAPSPCCLPPSPPTLETPGWPRCRAPHRLDQSAGHGPMQKPKCGPENLRAGQSRGPAPWPARSCSPHALCTASHQTWRSGSLPAQSRFPGTAPPGTSTGRWSRC